MITKPEKEALQEAINILGGQSAVARLFGIKQQSISQWLQNGLPYKRVMQLEKATRRKISRYRLKPSLFEVDDNKQTLRFP